MKMKLHLLNEIIYSYAALSVLLISCSGCTTIPNSTSSDYSVPNSRGYTIRRGSEYDLQLISVGSEDVYIKPRYKELIIEKLTDNLKNQDSTLLVFKKDLQDVLPLRRLVSKRPELASLAREAPFKIMFEICIVPDGEVVYSKLRSINDMNDKNEIANLQKLMFEYSFFPDNKAAELECGLFTINVSGAIYR